MPTLKLSVTQEVQAAQKALAPALKRVGKALKTDITKLPVGAAADLLYDLRQLTAQVRAVTASFDDVLGPAVKAVEEHFVQTLEVGESSGVQGHYSRIQVTESAVPTLEDPTKFYAYVRKTNSFELLNRALNRAAVQERWDQKKRIPGVGVFHVKKVSCTKLNGKQR